jgi:hypothetical protein
MAKVDYAIAFSSNTGNGIMEGFPRPFLETVPKNMGLLFFSPVEKRKVRIVLVN